MCHHCGSWHRMYIEAKYPYYLINLIDNVHLGTYSLLFIPWCYFECGTITSSQEIVTLCYCLLSMLALTDVATSDHKTNISHLLYWKRTNGWFRIMETVIHSIIAKKTIHGAISYITFDNLRGFVNITCFSIAIMKLRKSSGWRWDVKSLHGFHINW